MNQFRKLFAALCTVLVIGGCASAGLVVDTPEKKLAAGYTTVTVIAETTTSLLQASKISKADALNVKAGNDAALAGLDVASGMLKSNPTAATTKLDQIIGILTATQTYLALKGAK